MSTKHSSTQSWPRSIMALVQRCLADERGATAIEYALIASGIAAAIISIVSGLGNTVANVNGQLR